MQDGPDIETTLLGPVLADRACGDCTACCTVLTVDTPDFAKPAGVPCRHLSAAGCGIHADRPNICRSWFCGWRRVAALPEEARPDRSGLLVSLAFERSPRNCFEGVALHVRALGGRGSFDPAMAGAILDALCTGLVPVWFAADAEKMLMHPDAEVAQLVLSGDPAPPALAEEVAEWRALYGIFDPG